MRITVLGATGKVGSRVVTEALSRGHEVTAVVRNSTRFNDLPAAAKARAGDVGNVEDVARVSAGQDVVISAIRPAPGNESDIIPTTRSLMDGLAQTGVRLLVVGGAATLTVPGTGSKTVIEDSSFLPVSARHIGKASADQLDVCRAETPGGLGLFKPARAARARETHGQLQVGYRRTSTRSRGQLDNFHGGPRGCAPGRGRAAQASPDPIYRRILTSGQ